MIQGWIIRLSLASLLLLALVRVFPISIPKTPNGYVNDYAHLLNTAQSKQLLAYLAQLEKKTGSQVVVATFNTLGDQSLEAFSIKLADQWKIGQANKDNGVIVLVVKQDHQVRIEVGYGLEGVVTDAQSSIIIREVMLGPFKQGHFAKGLMAGVSRVGDLLLKAKGMASINMVPHNTHEVSQVSSDDGSSNWLGLLAVFLFITYYLGMAYIIISVIGNTILSCMHFFSHSKVTKSSRWFGPHAFFRITLFQALLIYFFFSGESKGVRGAKRAVGFVSGGGAFGGGGASGVW